MAAPDTELDFVRTPELDGRWDPAGAREALRAALDNPNVDFVLALGAGVSIAAAEVLLSKPVVATFVQRPDFGAIHEQANDRSQTENLAFMAIPQLLETDLGSLRSLFPFPEIAHLLVAESYISANEAVTAELQALEQVIGIRIELVPLGDSFSESVASLPADIVAAFVGRTQQWAASDRAKLFEGVDRPRRADLRPRRPRGCRSGSARRKNTRHFAARSPARSTQLERAHSWRLDRRPPGHAGC